jgi:hypothetical protein
MVEMVGLSSGRGEAGGEVRIDAVYRAGGTLTPRERLLMRIVAR